MGGDRLTPSHDRDFLVAIMRKHQRATNGTLRDTAVYSITADEWPTVRGHLDFQLSRPR